MLFEEFIDDTGTVVIVITSAHKINNSEVSGNVLHYVTFDEYVHCGLGSCSCSQKICMYVCTIEVHQIAYPVPNENKERKYLISGIYIRDIYM